TPPEGLGLRLFVGVRFQVLFHSPSGVLFTFPSRYYALSVARRYLALEGGPPGFPRASTSPAVLTRLPRRRPLFAYAAVTLCGGASQLLRLSKRPSARSPQPPPAIPATPPPQRLWAWHDDGLGSSPFARRFLGNLA